jgi:raffinose/stachyose/melibiose transport system permease protein
MEVVGLEQLQRPWLGSPDYAIYVVWIMSVWAGLGISMLFFIGAMKMLSFEIIESAKIDGAGYWYILFKVILPQIKITIVNIYILSYIHCMTLFDYSYMLAGGGGEAGPGNCYDVMTLFFYRVAFGSTGAQMGGSFEVNSMGMGTTIACFLFTIVALVSFFQIKFTYRNMEVNTY